MKKYPPKKRRWKCRRSPRLGLAAGSLPALARVVAMTAGCRAVLLAATAFWLAGRRLFKARSNGIGVGVFRQDGTSDRPLPVSISGADRVLVAHRDGSCVTGFHPVGSSSKQQKWRVVVVNVRPRRPGEAVAPR